MSSILKGYHRTLTETLSVLGHTDPNIYPFSDLVHDYQQAVIPAVGVAVTVLPGLVKETTDEARRIMFCNTFQLWGLLTIGVRIELMLQYVWPLGLN